MLSGIGHEPKCGADPLSFAILGLKGIHKDKNEAINRSNVAAVNTFFIFYE